MPNINKIITQKNRVTIIRSVNLVSLCG